METDRGQLNEIKRTQQAKKDDKEVLKFFAKLELGDLCFMSIINHGFALFGLTKAGKTTLAHHFVSNPLAGKVKEGNTTYYELKENATRFKEAIIGQTNQSETQIPNQFECTLRNENTNIKANVLDCPGYEDSNGLYMLIANGYFHYRIFSKVKNLKFILTFDYAEMSDVFEKPKATFIEFLSSFKNYAAIKDKIMLATVLVFTKIVRTGSEEETLKNITAKLLNLRNCGNLKNSKFYCQFVQELIDDVIAKNKVFFFERAEKGKDALNDDQLLRKIHAKTSFWTRQIKKVGNDTVVDMSSIEMTLGKRVINKSKIDEQFSEKLNKVITVFSERFKSAFSSFFQSNEISVQNILSTFLNDALTNQPESKNFFKIIVDFIQRYNIYTEGARGMIEYTQKRQLHHNQILSFPLNSVDKNEVNWIQKLEIGRLIVEMIHNPKIRDASDKSLAKFQSIVDIILQIICQFKKLRYEDQPRNYDFAINSFAYTVYRLLEEAKTFKIIFQVDMEQVGIRELSAHDIDTVMILNDFVQSMSDDHYDFSDGVRTPIDFEKARVNYFNNVLESIRDNQSLQYYLCIEKYFENCDKINNQKLCDKLNTLTTIKLKTNASKILRNEVINSLLDNIFNVKRNLQKEADSTKEEVYIEKVNDLAEAICTFGKGQKPNATEEKKSFRYAIQLLKHIKNVYRVVECYEELVNRLSEKDEPELLKNVLIEFAEFAASHGRHELAMKYYQRAYALIFKAHANIDKRAEQRQRIGQMIGMLGVQKRYDPSEQYYECMLMKKFIVFIDDSLIEDIRTAYPR